MPPAISGNSPPVAGLSNVKAVVVLCAASLVPDLFRLGEKISSPRRSSVGRSVAVPFRRPKQIPRADLPRPDAPCAPRHAGAPGGLSMADVPLQVVSDSTSSERRITPSWTIAQLKAKLEPVTGIPPSSQRLVLKTNGQGKFPIEAVDEHDTRLSDFPLAAHAELQVRLGFARPLRRALRSYTRRSDGIW